MNKFWKFVSVLTIAALLFAAVGLSTHIAYACRGWPNCPPPECIPGKNCPPPTEETPVPTEETPVPTEETPVPTEETPVPTEETPVPTDDGDDDNEKEPKPSATTVAPAIAAPVVCETCTSWLQICLEQTETMTVTIDGVTYVVNVEVTK